MRALLLSALLAAAGVTIAYRWFPQADSLGEYPARISRDEALVQARSVAARYGRDVTGWVAWVQGNRDPRTYEFLRTAPDHPMKRVPQPLYYLVVFTRGHERVRVVLGGNGMPAEFSFRDARRPEFAGQELPPEQERQVLEDFAGETGLGKYRKASSVNRGAQGHFTTWEWSDEDEPDLIQQIEVGSGRDGIRRVVMRSEFSSAFVERWVATFGAAGFRIVATPVIIFAGIGLTNALFFAGLARGHIKLKQALRLSAGLIAIWVVSFVFGTSFEQQLIEANANNQPVPERLLQSLGLAAAVCPLLAAMWAVGRALMRKVGL